jgi:preprotein translocase SecE subunit
MMAAVYKPGQGYWVRSLSAVFFGILVLAAAAWAWGQAAAVDLPIVGYSYQVTAFDGELEPGQRAELVGISRDLEERAVVIGTGTVQSFEQRTSRVSAVEIRDFTEAQGELRPDEATIIREAGFEDPAQDFRAQIRANTVRGIPVFPQLYLQAGVAAVIILLGAVLLFYFVGVKRSTVDFLIATDGEMRKVNWSSRREVIGSTWVVIIAAFLIAAILFVIDIGFSSAFEQIGVLQR